MIGTSANLESKDLFGVVFIQLTTLQASASPSDLSSTIRSNNSPPGQISVTCNKVQEMAD